MILASGSWRLYLRYQPRLITSDCGVDYFPTISGFFYGYCGLAFYFLPKGKRVAFVVHKFTGHYIGGNDRFLNFWG